MANLTDQDIEEVLAELMSDYSVIWAEIPVSSTVFFNWLKSNVEPELEACELAIFNATPAGPGKTWLQNNPIIGRDFILRIEAKRKEVL